MKRAMIAGLGLAAGLLLARPAQAQAAPAAADGVAERTAPELLNAAEMPSLERRYYPTLLHDAGVIGRARVRVQIDSLGRVVRAQAIGASHDAFAGPAEQVARKLRFRPAMQDGRPVASELTFPVDFLLDGARPLDQP